MSQSDFQFDSLVRDGSTKEYDDSGRCTYEGIPRFDEPEKATVGQLAMLTPQDWRHLEKSRPELYGILERRGAQLGWDRVSYIRGLQRQV